MAYAAFDLSGKVALITGGNRGIGLGMARALASAGADVVIWGTNESSNLAALEELGQLGVRTKAQTVDVADEAAVVEAMSEAVAVMGRIDTVIANAGIRRECALVLRNDGGDLASRALGQSRRRLLHLS